MTESTGLTKTIPTEDGFYWCRIHVMSSNGFLRGFVMIRVDGDQGIFESQGSFLAIPLAVLDAEWSTRLDPPGKTVKEIADELLRAESF